MGWLDMLFGQQTQEAPSAAPPVETRPSGFAQMLGKLQQDPALGQALLMFGASQFQPRAQNQSTMGALTKGAFDATMFKAQLDADLATREAQKKKLDVELARDKAATEASQASTARTVQNTSFEAAEQPTKLEALKNATEETRLKLKSAKTQSEIDDITAEYRRKKATILSQVAERDIAGAVLAEVSRPEMEKRKIEADILHADRTGQAALRNAAAAEQRAAMNAAGERSALASERNALKEAELIIRANQFEEKINEKISAAGYIVQGYEDTKARLEAAAKGKPVSGLAIAMESGIDFDKYAAAKGLLGQAKSKAREAGVLPEEKKVEGLPAVGKEPEAGVMRITKPDGTVIERPIGETSSSQYTKPVVEMSERTALKQELQFYENALQEDANNALTANTPGMTWLAKRLSPAEKDTYIRKIAILRKKLGEQ